MSGGAQLNRDAISATIVIVVLLQGGPNVYYSFDFRASFVRLKIGNQSQAWPEDMVLLARTTRLSHSTNSSIFMPTEYHGSAERPASLEEETKTTIEEARMVLPGIQALFGFQLIAVFNTRFQDFSSLEQILHLVALLLVAFAIALIMTPAAYHRIAERGIVSRRFVDLASGFLELALLPLMLGISLDLFLLGRLILNNAALSAAIASTMFIVFFGLWYVFPWTWAEKFKKRN
jgi:Family of unknown function (DUF6328)